MTFARRLVKAELEGFLDQLPPSRIILTSTTYYFLGDDASGQHLRLIKPPWKKPMTRYLAFDVQIFRLEPS